MIPDFAEMPVSRIGDNSAKSLVSSLESSLETPAEKRARLISIFVAHASMFLSGFGNSLIYIGMYPYLVSVKPTLTRLVVDMDKPRNLGLWFMVLGLLLMMLYLNYPMFFLSLFTWT